METIDALWSRWTSEDLIHVIFRRFIWMDYFDFVKSIYKPYKMKQKNKHFLCVSG